MKNFRVGGEIGADLAFEPTQRAAPIEITVFSRWGVRLD